MKIELDVIYENGETYEFRESQATLDVSDEKTISMVEDIKRGVTQEALDNFFRHLYDNPELDGSVVGVGYEVLWNQFSQYAFGGPNNRGLGWYDVTVNIARLRIDSKEIWNGSSPDNEIESYPWRLQLVREGQYMYCCS